MSVTIHPLADPHYLNLLNQLVAIRSSNGLSHLRPGVFHIFFTNTQNTTSHNREVEEKKNKQSRTWVSSKHKKGEVCDIFV